VNGDGPKTSMAVGSGDAGLLSKGEKKGIQDAQFWQHNNLCDTGEETGLKHSGGDKKKGIGILKKTRGVPRFK